jgi:hypothetical protein
MKIYKGLFLIFAIHAAAVFLISTCWAEPKIIEACGTGKTRNTAIRDALRNAVEMGLGTLIDSKTLIKNDELIRDRIFSQSAGYVAAYSILSENRMDKADAYRVCLRAEVQFVRIEDDLRAIGIIIQVVGNPRFMTVYVSERDASLRLGCRLVAASEQVVNSTFIQKGFLVLDRAVVRDVQNDIRRAGRAAWNVNALSSLALKKAADLLLVLDVGSVKRTDLTNKYFGEVSFDVSLRAVAPATAEIIASSADYANFRTARQAMDHADQNPMAEDTVRRLASKVSEAVSAGVVDHFAKQLHSGTRYVCLFKGFDQQEVPKILEQIENMGGFKGKNLRRWHLNEFEMDVHFLGKKLDLQEELKDALMEEGIQAYFQESTGNTLCLIKGTR